MTYETIGSIASRTPLETSRPSSFAPRVRPRANTNTSASGSNWRRRRIYLPRRVRRFRANLGCHPTRSRQRQQWLATQGPGACTRSGSIQPSYSGRRGSEGRWAAVECKRKTVRGSGGNLDGAFRKVSTQVFMPERRRLPAPLMLSPHPLPLILRRVACGA